MRYRFLSLPPGNYRLEASLAGFSTYIRDNLRVQVDGTTVENITLQVGTVTEQVTVTATAPVIDVEAAGTVRGAGERTLQVLMAAQQQIVPRAI